MKTLVIWLANQTEFVDSLVSDNHFYFIVIYDYDYSQVQSFGHPTVTYITFL